MPPSLSESSPEPIVYQLSSDSEDSRIGSGEDDPVIKPPLLQSDAPNNPPRRNFVEIFKVERPPDGHWYSIPANTWKTAGNPRKVTVAKTHAIENEFGVRAPQPCERCREKRHECRVFRPELELADRICGRCRFAQNRCSLSGEPGFRKRGPPRPKPYQPDLLNPSSAKQPAPKRPSSHLDRPAPASKKARVAPPPPPPAPKAESPTPTAPTPTREPPAATTPVPNHGLVVFPPSNHSQSTPTISAASLFIPAPAAVPPPPRGGALASLSEDIGDRIFEHVDKKLGDTWSARVRKGIAAEVMDEMLPELQALYDKMLAMEQTQGRMEGMLKMLVERERDGGEGGSLDGVGFVRDGG